MNLKLFQFWTLKALLLTFTLVHHHETLRTCPIQCTCSRSLTQCHDFIPMEYTNDIDILIIKSPNVSNMKPFAPGSFENLIRLEMTDICCGYLPNYLFSELKNLKHLKLQMRGDTYLNKITLQNLYKVEILDLSDNVQTAVATILSTLDNSNGQCLPALKKLYLRKLQIMYANPINIDADFVHRITSGRNVQYLDMSDTNIGLIDFTALEQLCKSLDSLIMKNCTVSGVKNVHGVGPCRLKTLDIAASELPVTRHLFDHNFERYAYCHDFPLFTEIETLNISSVIHSQEPIENIGLLVFSKCHFGFKKVIARDNNVKRINQTYEPANWFQQSLMHLDLSSNVIEYYSPMALNGVRNVRTLNLSSNRLNVMQLKQPNEFELLFSPCRRLLYLDLSSNMLTYIPTRTFVDNINLKFLNLSGNKLISFNVLIHSLTRLESLDLSKNRIVILSSDSLSRLDLLNQQGLTMFATSNRTNTSNDDAVYDNFHINLSLNPFRCDCDDEIKKFLEWIIRSKSVLRSNRTKYSCKLDNEQVDVSLSVLERSETVCWHEQLSRVFMVVGPITAGICVAVLIIIIGIQRHRRKLQKIERVIREIKDNTFLRRFLVFLSYSSEDCEFVHEYIYPPMSRMFADITECPRDLICFGDRHFHAGSPVHTEVVRCMEECAVVVFIVSNTFCRKGWCQMEVDEAYDQRKAIIMLMREHVDPVQMPKFLKTIFSRYTHASWVPDDNGGHIEPNWEDLCRDIIELASKQADYDGNGIKMINMK